MNTDDLINEANHSRNTDRNPDNMDQSLLESSNAQEQHISKETNELSNASNYQQKSAKGENEFNAYFTNLKSWINQFREQEKQAANIFAHSFQDFTAPFNLLSNTIGPEVYECQLASMWKRFCAEVIDYVILTIVQFYIINILHYGFDVSFTDYQNFLLLTSFSAELAIVEFISRVMLFVYESYFLSVDYATPGKKILGLKVVRVDIILEVPGRDAIYAMPCHRLDWWHAFFRSVLKNVGVLMFPICYGFMLTRYARSGYDYITKTIVIDTSRMPMRLVQPQEQAYTFLNGVRL